MRIRTGNNRRRAKAIKASGVYRPAGPPPKANRWGDAMTSVIESIDHYRSALFGLVGVSKAVTRVCK